MTTNAPPAPADGGADRDGPEAWCYDALERRTWSYRGGDGAMTITRGLEVVWIRFDGNPAVFANEVDGEQTIEDFLTNAPAVEVAAATLDEARAHLRAARRPGRSTWLALDVDAGAHRLAFAHWQVDGANPLEATVPGPSSAGVYGGAPSATRRGLRWLVTPGAVEVQIRGAVRVEGAPRWLEFEVRRRIAIASHRRHRVRAIIHQVAPLEVELCALPDP